MWFDVLVSYIILKGNVFIIHGRSVDVDEINIILALNNY